MPKKRKKHVWDAPWTYQDEEAYEMYARRYRRLGVASESTIRDALKCSGTRGGVRSRRG